MRSSIRAFIASIGIAALILCTSCQSKPASNGLFAVKLQTDWYPQPEHGGFYEAQLEGLYKAQGLDVTIVPGGPFLIGDQVVVTNAAQFGMSSSDKVLESVARGLPLIAVAATMQQDPQAIMLHADSPIRDFPDLDGHAIAARPGSIWLQFLIKRFNLKNVREIPATYSVASFLQDPNYIQQCFVTSEPFFAIQGGAHVRTMLIRDTGYQPYRVIMTSRRFLVDHPDVVDKFVKASMQGWHDYLADPTAVDAEIAKLNPAMSVEQMNYSVAHLKSGHFIDGEGTADSHLGHFLPQRWDGTYRQLVDLGVISRPMDPRKAYTTRYAP